MTDTVPVLDLIPLPPEGIPLPHEEKKGLEKPIHSVKRKSRHSDSVDEKDEHSRKKHKKSKKKDKHKDKEKSKKKEKKQSNEAELTAIEKFKMFKKQREAGKGDDKIVDDLFKDFIASKLKQIESDNSKTKEKKHKSRKEKDKKISSVDEMNRFLDNEINSIAFPKASSAIEPDDKEKTIEKTNKDKLEKGKPMDISKSISVAPLGKLSAIDNPTKLGSLLKSKQNKIKENITCDKSSVKERPPAEADFPLKKERDVLKTCQKTSNSAIPLPQENPDVGMAEDKPGTDKPVEEGQKESEKSLPMFGPFLPRSVAVSEKCDNTEEQKADIKKPQGFKHFGIKLSATSAELIQSGELHHKGKRLEEGSVLLL